MPNLAVGDLAQSLILGRHSASLKGALQTLSTEVTTGLVVDKTQRLAGDYAALAGIEGSLTQLQAYHAVTTETGILASVMQTALSSMSDHATELNSSLLAAVSGSSPTRIDTLGEEARQRLQSVMSALNVQIGGRNVFSGIATDRPAVTDSETMMNALDAAVAGATSSAAVEAAVTAWFDDPLGFAATVYQGGNPLEPVPISANETAQIAVTARDLAIVTTLKGLAMAALLQRGVLAGSAGARSDLARRAGESLASSAGARAELQARIGTTEAGIADAATRNSAERAALETARLGLLSVDPYETLTKLQQTQTQLETLYAITARLSRLSLVDFLR